MTVTFAINTGRPGEVSFEETAKSLDDAKTQYRLWLISTSRLGGTWEASFMDVTDKHGIEHRYIPGSVIGILRRV